MATLASGELDVTPASTAPEFSEFAPTDLTPKQWLYLQTVQELVGRRALPSQKEMAELLHIRPQTISEWNRQPRFLGVYRKVLTAHVAVGDLLCDLANQRQAQQGNVKAYELNLRRRGLYDRIPTEPESPAGAPSSTVAQVNFFGLPAPRTQAERDAMLPPPLSTKILTAAGLLEETRPVGAGSTKS